MKREKKSKSTEKSVTPQSFESDTERTQSVFSNDNLHSTTGEKTMTVNFETLSKAEQLKSVADYERYQTLLRDLAAGKEREETEILEILERVGRNVNMLKEDYEWRSKRDAMIAQVRKEAEYQSDRQAADAELKKLNDEFDKIEEEYNDKRWVLYAKQNQAKEKLTEIRRFCNELQSDCRDPHLHDEIERLNQQRQALTSTRYLNEKAEEIRLQIVFRQQEIDQLPAFCPGRNEKLQNIKAAIKDLQTRFEKVQIEIAEVRTKENEIEAAQNNVYGRMVFA